MHNQTEEGKPPKRHLNFDLFHMQGESFHVCLHTFNRRYILYSKHRRGLDFPRELPLECKEAWCRSMCSLLVHGSSRQWQCLVQWKGEGPLGKHLEKTMMTALSSALSGWCRQAAKQIGAFLAFLVMTAEEVTFVRVGWLAWWEILSWESTFHEQEMMWQERWQNVNRDFIEEGEICKCESNSEAWYPSVLLLSMINAKTTKGTCLGVAFKILWWNHSYLLLTISVFTNHGKVKRLQLI